MVSPELLSPELSARQRPHPQELRPRRAPLHRLVQSPRPADPARPDHPRRRGRLPGGPGAGDPTKKLRPAVLRKFFDVLVVRHVVILNPAASVRAERYAVVEGKTPEISAKQARDLLRSVDPSTLVGLRDRAIIAVLIYSAARVGAVAKLTLKSLKYDGTQYALRFSEKGGKSREIPVRHDLEQLLRDYIDAASVTEGPLFRTAVRRTKRLTAKVTSGTDICRMMKRRLKAAGLPGQFSPHSFRLTTVTDLLGRNVPLDIDQSYCLF